MVRCSNCNQPIKDSEFGWHNINCNKEHKMTREDAIGKCLDGLAMKPIELGGDIKVSQLINMLEKLGLLKFEEKKINKLFEITENNVYWPAANLYNKGLKEFNNKYGTIRLEEWPEGLVLWVGGEIVWKSWIAYAVMGEKFPR